MARKRSLNIKTRLLTTGIGILLILIAIGIITNFFIKDSFRHYSLLTTIKNVSNYELEMRKAEKNFILRETINPKFYLTGRSEYLQKFNALTMKVSQDLDYLKKNTDFKNVYYAELIDKINKRFEEYQQNFKELTEITKVKGFKDWGLVGKMRAQIHHVEDIADKSNNLLYTKHMLMLRRHEKDYLLRKDLKYRGRFNGRIDEFIAQLKKDGAERNAELIQSLKEYQDLFGQIIEKDILIGLTETADSDGIMTKLKTTTTEIEENLTELHEYIFDKSRENINNAILTLFLVTILLSVGIVFIIFRTSKYVVDSIKNLKGYILRLGNGELPDEITIKSNDEIGEMVASINDLTHNLKNTKDFAIEVGKGNFETDINVFNNTGDLGGSLVEMRNQLFKVAEERKAQEVQSQQRIWANAGMAKFGDILRKNYDNIEELCFELISNLVHYNEANQGGIFLKNDLNNKEETFDLVSTYAFNRRKYAEKTVKMGEGLVGTCAIEGETIYITDVPNDYVNITSGLGGANPRSILIVPLKLENEVLGVIEMASFNEFQKYRIEFIEKVAENIASTLSSVRVNQRTNELLEQTRSQAEELAAQEEEMRQNLEELQATQESLSEREGELKGEIVQLKEEKASFEDQINTLKEKLDKKNEEFLGILNAIDHSAIMLEYSLEGNLIFANDKFYDKMEHDKDNFDSNVNIRSLIPEDELEEFDKLWKNVINGVAQEEVVERQTNSGKSIWVWTSYTPIKDLKGRILKILYLGIDISYQKQKEMAAKRQLQIAEEELRQNLGEQKYSEVHKALISENERILSDKDEIKKIRR